MSQNDKVLAHMKIFGSITPLEAFEKYGIMRLGARIYDLKRMGYIIRGTNVEGVNRDGERVRYARYTLCP